MEIFFKPCFENDYPQFLIKSVVFMSNRFNSSKGILVSIILIYSLPTPYSLFAHVADIEYGEFCVF